MIIDARISTMRYYRYYKRRFQREQTIECQRSGDLLSEPAAHLLPQPSSNSAPALLSCACRRSASSFASVIWKRGW